MNPSREYLKTLKTTEREAIVTQIKEENGDIKVTGTHLFMIGRGTRSPSRKLVALLEKVTRGQVAAIDFDREMKDRIG